MTNLHVDKQFRRDAAVPVVVFSKASTALVATAAVSISEDRTGQDRRALEQREGPVLQYHCCALKILNTKSLSGRWSAHKHTHTLWCLISTQTDAIKQK